MNPARDEKETPSASIDDLRLPPAFVIDHCIRTLSYQGSISPLELANHWRVHPDIAGAAIDQLKASGLVEAEANQAGFERLGRVRLSGAGQARVPAARARTWYAGPVPVSLGEFDQRLRRPGQPFASGDSVRLALGPFFLEETRIAEIGQALASGATLALPGVAYDEQVEIAEALGAALLGTLELPFAVFAAGSVIRLFDARRHHVHEEREDPREQAPQILRTKTASDAGTRWTTIRRPLMTLSGGVMESDVVPAFDEDARFYVAPSPMVAIGGLLVVFDGDSDHAALGQLARLWLVPGRHGTGILLLRSGERIEVPWRAATVLFGSNAGALRSALREGLVYTIDVAPLTGTTLRAFLSRRLLNPETFHETAIDAIADGLERGGIATRGAAARATRYLLDRASYEGGSFVLTQGMLHQATQFASRGESERAA